MTVHDGTREAVAEAVAEAVGALDPVTTPTVSVPTAAKVLGISRGSGYEAARTGELPTIRLGRRLVVPTARLLEMLGQNTPAA